MKTRLLAVGAALALAITGMAVAKTNKLTGGVQGGSNDAVLSDASVSLKVKFNKKGKPKSVTRFSLGDLRLVCSDNTEPTFKSTLKGPLKLKRQPGAANTVIYAYNSPDADKDPTVEQKLSLIVNRKGKKATGALSVSTTRPSDPNFSCDSDSSSPTDGPAQFTAKK